MKPVLSGYDIIGDIHGHAEELKLILQKMGYELCDHAWTHPERHVLKWWKQLNNKRIFIRKNREVQITGCQH